MPSLLQLAVCIGIMFVGVDLIGFNDIQEQLTGSILFILGAVGIFLIDPFENK